MILREKSNSVLIQLQGRLDSETGTSFQQEIATIEHQRYTLWVLDMSKVEFIDSAGLVSLVSSLRYAKSKQCRFVICNPHPSVKLILEITQLDLAFEIFDSYKAIQEAYSQTEALSTAA